VLDGVAEGSLPEPANFEGFTALVKQRLAQTVREAAEGLDRTWKKRAETGCFPLAYGGRRHGPRGLPMCYRLCRRRSR
jgi:hypothetical protein